tara:strand:- start:5078 stop:5518 length:441 start_codon:yes stop_codon:yes gene_type:complete
MEALALQLASRDWILRSGAAVGADTAFESGAGLDKEIFTADSGIPDAAWNTVHRYHPNSGRLSYHVRKLMARNAMQIFGADMDTPVSFVVCWTPDAADGTNIPTSRLTGGTGQAIRIAADNGIPVWNLRNKETLKTLPQLIQSLPG